MTSGSFLVKKDTTGMILTLNQLTGDVLNASLKTALLVTLILNALNVPKVNSFKLMDLNVLITLNASFLIIFNLKDLKKEMESGSALNVMLESISVKVINVTKAINATLVMKT